MIGVLQWMVTIGQPYITTAVMTMSGFRLAPRNGHLETVKPTNQYLSKMRCLTIHPDCYNLMEMENEWLKLVYGEISELIPEVAPDPLGDRISGRSVPSIFYMINKIPLDWYSNIIKKKMINKIPLDWYSNTIKKKETKKKHQTNGEC
jgi:hypothetical protein